jgi:hypothetical protein
MLACRTNNTHAQRPARVAVRVIPTTPQSEAGQPAITLPAPSGPYRVGRMSFYAVDSMRGEVMTSDPTDLRELLFHVWYPTQDSSGTLASFIALSPDDSVFRRSYAGLRIERLQRVRAHSFADARVSDAAPSYPVVLFSHGLGTVSRLYTSFLEDLASHGYIVVGVDHPYYSSALKMPDGRVVDNRSRPADRQRDVVAQAQDLSFVVTVLEQVNRGVPPTRLAGRLQLAQLGVFGHSRGGFAAPHACHLDRRFKACANLDGYTMTPAVMDSGITQPFMLIEEMAPWLPPPTDSELNATGTTRAEADAQAVRDSLRREAMFSRMTGGAYLVVSPGAVHNSFSNVAFIAPERFPTARQDFSRTIEITSAYLLAFFDKHLRGRSSPLLQGRSPYREVSLTIYRPGGAKQVFRGAVPVSCMRC